MCKIKQLRLGFMVLRNDKPGFWVPGLSKRKNLSESNEHTINIFVRVRLTQFKEKRERFILDLSRTF